MDVWIKTQDGSPVRCDKGIYSSDGNFSYICQRGDSDNDSPLAKYHTMERRDEVLAYMCEEIRQAILNSKSAVYIELPEG